MAVTYTPTTNFGAKDSLPQNDPDKVIKGTEFTTEFTAIQTAFSLAATAASPTFTGTATLPSVDINGGTIDGTSIGASSKSSGAFTSLEVFATSPSLLLTETDITDKNTKLVNGGGNFFIQEISNDGLTSVNRIKLDHTTGNMTFYDDTSAGTVLFLDAVNNRAGINTINPASTLDVNGTVTADGLTVEGTSPKIFLSETDKTDLNARVRSSNGFFQVQSVDDSDANPVTRFQIEHATGDISFYEDTGTTPKFFWDASAERLGIGTATPGGPLEVTVASGTSGSASGFRLISADGGGYAIYPASAVANPVWNTNVNSGEQISWSVGGGEVVRITSAGNVGIGTTSPSESLETTGNIQIKYVGQNTDPSGARYLIFNNTDTTLVADQPLGGLSWVNNDASATAGEAAYVKAYAANNTGTSELRFGTGTQNGATERMRITSAGNVGIGTTPDNKLDVGSAGDAAINMSATADGILRLSGGGYSFAIANNGTGTYLYNNGSSRAMVFGLNETEVARIDSSGNLQVGTTDIANDPGVQLFGAGNIFTHIAGTGSVNQLRFYRDSAIVGSISTSGTSTAYNTSSDARLKENIADAEDASSLVDAIKVRQFDWKADGSHQRYGMVAQELLEVAPEAVSGDFESDDMMGVDYSKLVPMLVKEIQSLRARVAQLEGA